MRPVVIQRMLASSESRFIGLWDGIVKLGLLGHVDHTKGTSIQGTRWAGAVNPRLHVNVHGGVMML